MYFTHIYLLIEEYLLLMYASTAINKDCLVQHESLGLANPLVAQMGAKEQWYILTCVICPWPAEHTL